MMKLIDKRKVAKGSPLGDESDQTEEFSLTVYLCPDGYTYLGSVYWSNGVTIGKKRSKCH
jgi:hypothetical protein